MTNPFDMQYVISVIKKWLRPIIAFVLLATLAGGLATLALPRKYLSVATIVPADPSLNDKAYLYGTNIQELRSVYGKEEDLDRLLATAGLDGNLNFLVDSFNLAAHYGITGNAEKAKYNSYRQLKKNSHILKTENGTVKIEVWDTDKKMAADMANALVERTGQVSAENNKKANAAFLAQLEQNVAQKLERYRRMDLPGSDTTRTAADRDLHETEKRALLSGIESDMKMQDQLQTAINANNPSLVVLEKAYPSATTDKPRPVLWILGSFFASLFFAVLLALVAESFKRKS